MASIKPYNLKSGALRYEVFVSNGLDPGTRRQRKIHKKGFLTHEAALKWAKITEGNIASDGYLKVNPEKLTLEIFLNDWIDNYKQAVKEGTRIVHRENIRMYITPFIGKFQLDKYKRSDHQKFINMLLNLKGRGLSGNGLSVTTVRSVNGTLSNAFKKAIQLELVSKNPTNYVEFPRQNKSSKEKLKYYSYDETEKFLEFAQKERMFVWYPFFLLIFEAGLRKSEVLGLEWHHIDFANSKVSIVQQRLIRAEKKENVGTFIVDEVKTPSGRRTIPLTNRTKIALLELRNKLIQKFGYLPAIGSRAFIFVNTQGKNKGLPLKDNTVNNAFIRIINRAELDRIKVHDGRHTFAVRLRQAGLSLEDIKDLLGHKDISTTQIYAHISPEVQQRSIDMLEDYLLEQRKKHS